MTTTLFVVALVVLTALVFDFTNGFHDSANAMATSVATGALRPRTAVLIAAVLNIVGAFLSTEVAKTISGGIVNDPVVTPVMIFAGLVGAILWNLTTWLFGLPSSSSHALFGGLIGAVLVGAGTSGVNFSVIVSKILLPAVVAPLVAGLAAGLATYLIYQWLKRADEEPAAGWYRRGQTISGSMIALAHGTSDGQKTMGVITLVLITAGYQESGTGPQLWVIATAGLAIGLGTYSGGWRIMRTMGKGIVDVKSPQGLAAETTSAAAILASSHMGFGLSTTQVCAGSIVGSGVGRKVVRRSVGDNPQDGVRLAAHPAGGRPDRRDRRRHRRHRHPRPGHCLRRSGGRFRHHLDHLPARAGLRRQCQRFPRRRDQPGEVDSRRERRATDRRDGMRSARTTTTDRCVDEE